MSPRAAWRYCREVVSGFPNFGLGSLGEGRIRLEPGCKVKKPRESALLTVGCAKLGRRPRCGVRGKRRAYTVQVWLTTGQQKELARRAKDEMRAVGQKVAGIAPETLRILMAYHWPGNVRELKNVLQAGALAADGETIELFHLPEDVSSGASGGMSGHASRSACESPAQDDECQAIKVSLLESTGDKSAACRILGWNRMKLYRRMRKYHIPLDFGRPNRN